MFLLVNSLYQDTVVKPYGGYHAFWQGCGFFFPVAGIVIFIVSALACKEPEPFDHDVDAAFDENDRTGVGAESSYAAGAAKAEKDTEMAVVTNRENSTNN